MSKLKLSVAIGNYDRVRPLFDGAVQIDGVDPVFMTLPPEEIFFRAFRTMDFDICELSMSSFTVKTAQGNCPYVGVPAFVSRAFRHNSIYVRTDRIKTPDDLKGKRIGLPEYQLTACVWARDHPGARPRHQAVGRDLGAGRHRRSEPAGEDHDQAAAGRAAGERARGQDHLAAAGERRDRRLHRAAGAAPGRQATIRISAGCFADPIAAGKDYYKRTGIFPIMHVTGIRRTLVEQHPWLPAAVLKAFEQSKAKCLEELEDTATSKCTLPFVDEQLKAARELMGHDFWSYGLAPNRKVLETFLRHHHAEGLSSRLVTPEEMFHPSTHETFTI